MVNPLGSTHSKGDLKQRKTSFLVSNRLNHSANSQKGQSEFDRRMDRISDSLKQMGGNITEYDDVRVRQLVSHIKAMDKNTLLVCFKDGTEVVQPV